MLQSLTKLLIRQTKLVQPLIFSKRHNIRFKNFASFCTTKYPPIIQDLLKVEDVKQLQTSLIEIYKLNDNNKRFSLRIIMQRIQDGVFPHNVLIDQKFQIHIKKFPDLHIEALLFRIQEQLSQLEIIIKVKNQAAKKLAVKDINNCFAIIFQTLKKVTKNQVVKLQIRAYKSFAEYHQKYLMRLIEHKRYKQILTKSLNFYKAALNKITAFLEKQQAKVAQKNLFGQLKEEDLIDVDELTDEKTELIKNTIQYKRHTYSQEYCEILYEVMSIQNYITDPRIKQTPRPRSKLQIEFMYHQGLFGLIPLFQKALDLLQKTQKIHNQYYYKIKKTHLQLIYHKNLFQHKEDENYFEQQTIEFNKRMQLFAQQIIQNLKTLPAEQQAVYLCQQMTLVLLGIKSSNLSLFDIDQPTYQKLLIKEIQSILNIIQDEDLKKFILSSFTIAVSKTMNINLQKYFGKSPRPVQYRQRPLKQQEDRQDQKK